MKRPQSIWSHADLVRAAAKWLRGKCPVVITEMSSGAWEEPDAIGWTAYKSILVECKASRADLRADVDKTHRRREQAAAGSRWAGLGDDRYYLIPDGMVDLDSPLFGAGWGILVMSAEGRVVKKRDAEHRSGDAHSERALLVSCVRRLGVQSSGGTSVKVYVTQTKCRATVRIRAQKDAGKPAGADI